MALNTRLITESDSWMHLYVTTLHNMRSKWPQAWPGLPVVLDACIQRLWPHHYPERRTSCYKLLQVAGAMALFMEEFALKMDYEPHYHNRLHTADALTAACLLIQSLRNNRYFLSDDWTAALLLAVTAHDVLHPGGANGFAQEFEQRSAIEMRHIAFEFAIEALWLQRVSELILRTDPALVTNNHEKVKDKSFVMDLDWGCVLMNEADILASATSRYGPALGHALATEWTLKNHPLQHVVSTNTARFDFLSSLQFSTPASEAFHMREHVASQIAKL